MNNERASTPEPEQEPFSSNAVRLSARQWLVVGFLVGLVFIVTGPFWKEIEPFEPGADYRIPYSLGYDYWMFDRYCGEVTGEDRTLLIGDSVVWGHYVACDETLGHYLNELAETDRFANLGVDGIHPVAMAGLLDSYGQSIQDERVILHCNFLWMSSERHDLQTEKEFAFNHQELVPQFYPQIPCYRETTARRLAIVVRRRVPFLGWARHMRIAYFDGDTFPKWTIEHPYANPLSAITLDLPSPDESPTPKPDARPWTEQKLNRFDPKWVDLETSLQWNHFRQTLEILNKRGNKVFVLIGPLNEHMLSGDSRRRYRHVRKEAEELLSANQHTYWTAPVLPSEDYADASHPLANGYRRLADELWKSEEFRQFLSQ